MLIINSRKKFWFLYFLMLVLELLIAGFVLTRFGFNFYQGGDSSGYMYMARNLAENGALFPTNFRTPGYLFFLALIYFIFHSFVPAIFFGALISAFAAPLIYLIAKKLFEERVAFIAGVLAAIEPMGLFLGISILTEGVFTSVLLLSVYFFIKYLKAGNVARLYYSGALLALSTLIRPIMFYFWPIAILFVLRKEYTNGWRLTCKRALIFVVIFFLILSSWLIRNKIVVNSWQITSLQGYIFFIDHYGAVLRYLGEAGPLSDVQAKALTLVGSDKIFTSEGSDILFKSAIDGIKQHKLAYANVYAKSLISFFIANGYKSLFIDILGVPAQAPYVPFELFLRFDFKSILKTLDNMDFFGILIYWGSKILWVAIFLSFLIALIYLLWNKNYRSVRVEIAFLATVIFYFALITGPTAVGGGRTKAPVNGLIFIFVVFGIAHFFGYLKRKFA
ncbi:MAG: glycosyltransferase family 39 protein [Candidatus Azambacteria bacterium]|nr:glycosyltransferase family 39 protein [Candidatus Azambacteria bacterium]